MFLFSALSSSVARSKRFTPHPWLTCCFRHQLDFSGKHSSPAAITSQYFSFIFPPLSIAKYSIIRRSQLGHCGENNNAQIRNGSKEYSNPGSLDCDSGILPLNYRAPQATIERVSLLYLLYIIGGRHFFME